jgi:hypothetical protein
MSKDNYSAFHALDPFFSIVMEGLSKYTDGEHYFDTLANDVLFEFRYLMAGWRRRYEVGQTSCRSISGTATASSLSVAMRWPRILPRMVTL